MARKFAPYQTKPDLLPKQFDPAQQTFVPDLSLTNVKVHDISTTKVQMLGAKVYNSMTQSITSNTSWHDLTFDTKAFDEGNLWRVGDPTKFKIPYSGIWSVSVFTSWTADASDFRRLQLVLNASTTLLRFVAATLGDTVQTDVFLGSDFKLSAGDVLTAQARQASGGALDILDGEDDNFFCATFKGPI